MELNEYQAAVENAQTPEALWAAFAGYFRGTVVRRLNYLHLPPLGASDGNQPKIATSGFPEDLVAFYFAERLYRDNPVLNEAQLARRSRSTGTRSTRCAR